MKTEDKDQLTRTEPVKSGLEIQSITGLMKHIASWPIVAYLSLLVFVTTLAFEYGSFCFWKLPFGLVRFVPENAFRVFFLLFSAYIYSF